MTSGDQIRFGALLRQFRHVAQLSQEALAERAGVGVDTVSALERGVNAAPYRTTVARLAEALSLSAHERAKLEAAAGRARRRRVVDLAPGANSEAAPSTVLPGNMTLSSSELIGRDEMMLELRQLVARQRHVTLVGSGGIGKTRVAIALARWMQPRFPDGAWFIDLVSVADSASVAGKVAAELGLREAPDRAVAQGLVAALAHRKLLLLFDNCEHVVDAVSALADMLLAAAHEVQIIATSREPLRISDEYVYNVGALSYPMSGHRVSAREASRFGAVALFVARARAADQRFTLTDQNAEQVADICRRVEGIALGVELAASRVKALGLSNLTLRLERLLPTLTGGHRTARRHHQTMRAVIDWSYDLLGDEERALLHRVAIFVGGWTLEAAELVGAEERRESIQTLDVLSALVDKSQIVAEHHGSHTRYRLLYSVREYALEKLDASGERDAAALRHATWVAQFAEAAAASAWTVPRRKWLLSIVPEIDNIRAALSWALSVEETYGLAGRIVASLGLFWYYSGLAREGRMHCELLLQRLGTRAGSELEAGLWAALAALRAGAGRVDAAQHAIRIYERLGDRRRLGISYLQLAIAYRQMTKFAETQHAVERALALFRQTGDEHSTYYASALGWRASALIGLQRFDEARAHFEDDIALYERLNDEGLAAVERLNFAELEFSVGNLGRAVDLVERGLRSLQAEAIELNLSNDYTQVVFYLNLAAYRLVLGEIDAAQSAAREALVRAGGLQYPLYIAIAIQHFATIAALGGDARTGARLRGFVDAVYRKEGVQREPTEQHIDDLLMSALRDALSPAELDRLAAQGAALTEHEAVEGALTIGKTRRRKAESVRTSDDAAPLNVSHD